MSRTTFVDRCEEKSDITRVFLKDGVSFDLPLLVMHKERKIVGELFKRFTLGTCIQYEIIFGDTCPPSGDLVLQGEILHVNGSDIIASAVVLSSGSATSTKENWLNQRHFSVSF